LLDSLKSFRLTQERPALSIALAVGIFLAVTLTAGLSTSKVTPRNQTAAPGGPAPTGLDGMPRQRSSDILITGKLFCSLKRNIAIPFRGIVSALNVNPGQQVKEGDVLVRYRLPPDTIQSVRRRLDPPQIRDLQLRVADLDKNMSGLNVKLKEMRQLARENMAAPQSVASLEMEYQLLAKTRSSVQERIQSEMKLVKDDVAILKSQLGRDVSVDRIPEEASLLAPISGHVIGIHSELREGSELASGTPAIVVGVVDPMIMRTQVHEIEAIQIGLGDEAEVNLESIPNRVFKGTVSRLSWTPVTPGVDQPSYYELELQLPNPDLSLREGLKGYARFAATGSQQQ